MVNNAVDAVRITSHERSGNSPHVTRSRCYESIGACAAHRLSCVICSAVRAQVEAIGRAAVVVAVHGADLMNMAWLPRGASVLEIAPVHSGYGGRTVPPALPARPLIVYSFLTPPYSPQSI